MDKTYDEGFVDGVSAYINVCSKHPDCAGCPLADEFAGDTTCETFIQRNPKRAASLLKQDLHKVHTYFAEYRLRFPHSDITLENMAESACRKAIFNGDMTCSGGDCAACWNEEYFSDAT